MQSYACLLRSSILFSSTYSEKNVYGIATLVISHMHICKSNLFRSFSAEVEVGGAISEAHFNAGREGEGMDPAWVHWPNCQTNEELHRG